MEAVGMPSFRAAGPARLAELRAEGTNPSATPQAQAKRKATLKDRAAARAVWEREHAGEEVDKALFRRAILPKLQSASLSAMMRATGLSVKYCADIRRGDRV